MELQHFLAARLLMEPVDVLGQHRPELACRFQLRQLQVADVGFGVQGQHFVPVEPIELLGIADKIAVGDDGLRRFVVALIVETILAAEIGYAALGRHPSAAEKDDVAALVHPLL